MRISVWSSDVCPSDRTPGGIVRARRVAVATGGYTPQGRHKSLTNKIMPILSNSVVTRPLTADERAEAGLKTTTFITDTRTLRFYYRLLPDGSMQTGSRRDRKRHRLNSSP